MTVQLIPGRFRFQPGLLGGAVGVVLTRPLTASQQMLSVATAILWLFSTNKDSVVTLISALPPPPPPASFSTTSALADSHFHYVKCFFKAG